ALSAFATWGTPACPQIIAQGHSQSDAITLPHSSVAVPGPGRRAAAQLGHEHGVVSGHFFFDGLRLALLRPSYRGRRAGVDSFRFLRLLMVSPHSAFKVERCRPRRVPPWSRPPHDHSEARP